MSDHDAGRFTVGVFQDAEWAGRGLDALVRGGLLPESLTVMAAASPAVAALAERVLGVPPETIRVAVVGEAVVSGSLVGVLQGSGRDLSTLGLSGTMHRIGFQSHDARIYEALVCRGGVLVAIHSEPRAADALAVLHAYGGGNAAIGAWTGRL